MTINWRTDIENAPQDKTSFFATMLGELGIARMVKEFDGSIQGAFVNLKTFVKWGFDSPMVFDKWAEIPDVEDE